MTCERSKTIFKRTVGISLAFYVGLYGANSFFGGYDPNYNRDGWSRNKSGSLSNHCILWQPRFGLYYNWQKHDLMGLVFCPLIRFDQLLVHITHTPTDYDFVDWWKQTTGNEIHPLFQQDFKRMKQ